MAEVEGTTGVTFARAPSACGDEFENVEWAGTLAVHLQGDHHVGVRFNNRSLLDLVASALGDRVRAVPDPVPFFSVRMGAPGRRRAAPLHHLYLGARPILGTRDLGRLIRGLARHLSAQLEPPSGYVVEAVPVGTPHGVLLVPREILTMPGSVDRMLTPAGFVFADVPRCRLHPADLTVEVPVPVVELHVPEERLAGLGPSVSERRLADGVHRLAGWLLGTGADQVGPLRASQGVAYAARLLHAPFPSGAQAALDDLLVLAKGVPFRGVAWAAHDELVSQLMLAGTAGLSPDTGGGSWTS